MESFLKFLLEDLGAKPSDVTIVDDKASPELSAALFLLNRPVLSSSDFNRSSVSDVVSSASRPCRWSNMTEDMQDLRIAKRMLSDLRTRNVAMSMSSPSLSTSRHALDIGGNRRIKTISSTTNIGFPSRESPSNRYDRSTSSLPSADRTLPVNRSNPGWDDKALWHDVTSRMMNKNIEARKSKMQKQLKDDFVSSKSFHFDSDVENSLSSREEEEEIRSNDGLSSGEDSIDILEDFMEDWAVRKDLDSNSSTERFSTSSSSISNLKPHGQGSSADMTDSTFDMDASYQSFLDYSKLVSNHQAPRLPQRKISQEKLVTLTPFLNMNSNIGKIHTKNNASFDQVPTVSGQQQRREPKTSHADILPFISSASQVLASGPRDIRKKRTGLDSFIGVDRVFGSKKLSTEEDIRSKNIDLERLERARRLREALGSMAPSRRKHDDDTAGPRKFRWKSYRSRIKKNSEDVTVKEQRSSQSQSPPRTFNPRGGGDKAVSGSSGTAALVPRRTKAVCSNSSSSNSSSSSSSSPNHSVDDSSYSTLSIHSEETVKSSNLRQSVTMPNSVGSTVMEDSLAK